jgi:hypothetical protein
MENRNGQMIDLRVGQASGRAECEQGLVRRVNYFCRRIDSRLLLPSRRPLPHVNCYCAANLLRGGGGDGEATEHGDTPRA